MATIIGNWVRMATTPPFASGVWFTGTAIPVFQADPSAASDGTNGFVFLDAGTEFRAYRYSPATDSWSLSTAPNSPAANSPRVPTFGRKGTWAEYSGTLAYIGGGNDPFGASDAVWTWNPSTNAWARVYSGASASNGFGYSGSLRVGSSFYIAGTLDVSGSFSSNVLVRRLRRFDTATNTMTALASVPSTIGFYPASPVMGEVGGKILSTAAVSPTTSPATSSTYIIEYDPATNTWASLASTTMTNASCWWASGVCDGSGLIVTGGAATTKTGTGGPWVPLTEQGTTARYDRTSNAWTIGGTVQPTPRAASARWTTGSPGTQTLYTVGGRTGLTATYYTNNQRYQV